MRQQTVVGQIELLVPEQLRCNWVDWTLLPANGDNSDTGGDKVLRKIGAVLSVAAKDQRTGFPVRIKMHATTTRESAQAVRATYRRPSGSPPNCLRPLY